MGKDFLKFNVDSPITRRILLIGGFTLSVGLGILAYQQSKLEKGYELPKNEAGEGDYEQELIAKTKNRRIELKIIVKEQIYTEEEAEKEFKKAESVLNDLLKGNNESFASISSALYFADMVPGTAVKVTWTDKASDYFRMDGTVREDLELREPVKLKVAAILNCQDYTKDYEAVITLLPPTVTDEKKLLDIIHRSEKKDEKVIFLPEKYEGQSITWRKPIDITFLYVWLLTVLAAVLLRIGEKKDARDRKRELYDSYEKDYAQIVSKFTMLLSAGLSIRNAWERIVVLYQTGSEKNSPILQEMSQSYREMQKGVSEIAVYENFGVRVGQVHYKKLMAMLISHKKRGSVNLLDAMTQEMLQAWEEQRRKVRQQGEKIGTKLLVPMMGMLAVVFVMILIPAFLAFQL